jgi:hypothetical protein
MVTPVTFKGEVTSFKRTRDPLLPGSRVAFAAEPDGRVVWSVSIS